MKKNAKPLTAEQIAEQIAKQTEQKNTYYPDAALSEKQMAALYNVIDTKNPEKKSTKKRKKDNEIKGGSPVKTVLWVIFILILLGGAGFAGLYYWWTNHATFDYVLQPVVILEGQTIQADDFLTPGENDHGIHAHLQDPGFEPETEFHFVPVTLTYGLRSLEAEAILFVLTPVESITHEFAESAAIPRPASFLINARAAADIEYDIRFIEEPQPFETYPVGEHILRLALNDVPFEVILIVEDTTPPTALITHHTIRIGESAEPEDFVTDIHDASPIATVEFVNEPNVFYRGSDQTVEILIEDIHGNSAIFPSQLTIQLNQLPPTIEGVIEMIESEFKTPIDYPMDVTAFDDFGRPLEVHINDSGVDTDTPGRYTAVYWAEDLTGNITEIPVIVNILSVNPEEVYAQLDLILGRIINDRMNQQEKALAIHNWVRTNFSRSTTGSEALTSIEIAGEALLSGRHRSGSSQIYAAVSEVLLIRVGIPVRPIERIETAATPHHWLLIDPDDKGWHHFDPFPTGHVLGALTAMFTEEEAKDIARRVRAQYKVEDYYTYDKELYTDIVQE